jgi:hypothetical protein
LFSDVERALCDDNASAAESDTVAVQLDAKRARAPEGVALLDQHRGPTHN